ncbi:unnamed protein product [Gadus morhua 'NCC']
MSRDIVGNGCYSLAGSPVSTISSRGTGLLEAQRGAKGQTEEKGTDGRAGKDTPAPSATPPRKIWQD